MALWQRPGSGCSLSEVPVRVQEPELFFMARDQENLGQWVWWFWDFPREKIAGFLEFDMRNRKTSCALT